MKVDDVIAYLASKPNKEKPTKLRSSAKMLKVWLLAREDSGFRQDVIIRHGLLHIEKKNRA